MKKTTDPPRLAIWLLTRRLSAEWRDFVVGDLEEEFATRSGDSPVAAHAWFWWQTMRCLAAPPPVRPNLLPVGSSQGDSRMRTLFADLRYAFRVMSRTPSFAVAVVSVLALGIGANTAIFSIVNAVLLRPLPFEEPERLVRIFTRTPGPGSRLFELSPGKFYDWQRDAQSFEGMAMYPCCGFRELALTGTGTARTVRVTAVSAGFFEIVRARPALGRVFRPEEDTPGGKYVVVLSDRFWRTEFGGNPDVIGRTVKLNDEAYTIVGVMPATASVASWTAMASDVWVPLALTDEQRAARGNHNRDGVARLNRDVEHSPYTTMGTQENDRAAIPGGVLDLLILRSLARGPMHGYEIAEHIGRLSQDVLQLGEGTLYPTLQRLLIKGWVVAEWGVSVNNRRARYYRLTVAGRKRFAWEMAEYQRVATAIARVLAPA